MDYPDWRAYQHATADVFRKLGCNAKVDFTVAGARASHAIDVYATFLRSGILCTWVIECKLWKSRVTKEKVLALKSILEDLGADRGIMVSEEGFQSGAQDAARGTNITLVKSLEEFAKTAIAAAVEVPLALSVQRAGEPVYQFPDQAGPHGLLPYGDVIITANWAGGTISVVNPATKTIVRTIELDKYEAVSPLTGAREIRTHPPGSIVIADGRLFVGQVFSDVILVIDLATHAIIKRIAVSGGGDGQLAVSQDGKTVYFASNRVNQFYLIDSATYAVEAVAYPVGGRGCMSLLCHPTRPLIYLGIQRGGRIDGRGYPYANCYVALYDLELREYTTNCQLAEMISGRSDDATPVCLTYEEVYERVYVGMFQSRRGICVLDANSGQSLGDIRFDPTPSNKHFAWVDPLSQTMCGDLLLSVNRNNCELVAMDRQSFHIRASIFLGEAPSGPRDVLVWQQHVIVSYPERNGLIFVPVATLS